MAKITREDIHLISGCSSADKEQLHQILINRIYSTPKEWLKFIKILTFSAGVGFTVSGIIFFFAYNWDNLHKFTKLGIVEAILLASVIPLLSGRITEQNKKIILTGASLLVGGVFAVYGQIYQTGANAFDFFLVWTLFVSIWVFTINYAPLYTLYTALLNTTIILFSQQIAFNMSFIQLMFLLLLLNSLIVTAVFFTGSRSDQTAIPEWFPNLVSLAALVFSTSGIIYGIVDKPEDPYFLWLILTTGTLFYTAVKYGSKAQKLFYPATIPINIVIIFSACLLRISFNAATLLLVTCIIIASITITAVKLKDLKQKWQGVAE